MQIEIRPFQPAQQAEVKALILAGLAERWGEVFDPGLNTDLDDISQTYANALFLVATQNQKIVGAGALLFKPEGVAEVVRMSTAQDARRKGIGGKILRELCVQAKTRGCKTIILETTHNWQTAIQFYKRFGFEITHHQGADVYFALNLETLHL
ncbi:MAG: GNAT family N-acetyltransferase [Anaerolineales bacterium]|nr:GNAT family N-acetyltransferase [Anaerolineales bacterium]